MDKMPCLPVKITAKKWADKLQDGSVFMRSLYDFGSWSAIERHNRADSQMKDGDQSRHERHVLYRRKLLSVFKNLLHVRAYISHSRKKI